ncbi:MAG TPA: DUF488 domain-containing protein [Gaiellaceae bacterium]|nr:DUF488 domain-containing protein [Gaiellaceae bacterium]
MRVLTVGHGTRSLEELVEMLSAAEARTLVDVRRYPGSRRNPQFGREALARALSENGIEYRHAVELGGRLRNVSGEERFACIRNDSFRSYTAHMDSPEWQRALDEALAEPAPCLMCSETPWQRCHRRFIAELLVARGHEVLHLLRPGTSEPHVLLDEAEVRDGKLYLCGQPVA